jgi:hypothetical protein
MPVCAELMYAQYAVRSTNTEVIAELLDCGVDVDATIHYSTMDNALISASKFKHLDAVRFLLSRGASADRSNRFGDGAGTMCWFRDDALTRHSSMDIFNLLVENSHFDVNGDFDNYMSPLTTAAVDTCGVQIDALVRFGADVYLNNDYRAASIHCAAWYGNYSAYYALASYHDKNDFENNIKFVSELLLNTLCGRLSRMDERPEFLYHNLNRSPEYDQIMMDMFQRGVGPRTRLRVSDSVLDLTSLSFYPPDLLGIDDQDFEVDTLAAALGPETEAWYLGLLNRCGLLAHGDHQRLHDLAEAGHVADGFVYEIAEESGEVDRRMRGDHEEDGDVSDLGRKDIYPDTDDISHGSSTSESDEANQFWDAEESL